jgi:hypothetical protein
MATRSYVIPDLEDDDDDNQIESPNLFSKRLKTDHSSTINENTSTTSSSIPSNAISDIESSNTNQLSDENASSTVGSLPRPAAPGPSSSSLLVHSRQ